MRMFLFRCLTISFTVITLLVLSGVVTAAPLKVLIVDGQNNHKNWPQTTQMMKQYLEGSGLFMVSVKTHAARGEDPTFTPPFTDYDVVVNNFGHGSSPWPTATQTALEDFISAGGGLVVIHAADNAFPEWEAYNEMIGLGGWGGRTEKNGPYIYYNDNGELIRDTSPGRGGAHGPQAPFPIIIRDNNHPITAGMPSTWMHAKDELYDSLRGPAENLAVLATAFSPRTNRHEPILMTIRYGKGRVFHTPMGHANESQECVGFITSFLRGCEWAATGSVTIALPTDFPTADRVHSRPFEQP